ncbi:hypothetical protein KFK09_019493 [Dendrobium nobile]|uniref:TF-B3 domain-containing protein n=1 Tax=Dendrobium nobile TaxID=94219 RepID=A0A8T3AQD2_DENNO|nr:hypothetical protein KFK09_019493 [Dendrobium nobile]
MHRRSCAGKPAPPAAPQPAPVMNPRQAAVNHAPPLAPVQGGGSMLGGIGSTTAQGMAFGTESAEVATPAVDAVLGPRNIQLETLASQVPEAASVPMTRASIVPFEGKPYFTVIMGESNVHRHFLVDIPKTFHQFLPPSSARIALCYGEKEWFVKWYPSIKVMRDGWKQFVGDNNLMIGDGCVFELMDNKELKFKVQILSGELPATKVGGSIDSSIIID